MGESPREVVDDLSFGLIPEFVGRLPALATLDEAMSRFDLASLTEPKRLTARAQSCRNEAWTEFCTDALNWHCRALSIGARIRASISKACCST